MLNTFEKKKRYVQQTRLKNYRASLVLEGIQVSTSESQLTKTQLLKKYQQARVNSAWTNIVHLEIKSIVIPKLIF